MEPPSEKLRIRPTIAHKIAALFLLLLSFGCSADKRIQNAQATNSNNSTTQAAEDRGKACESGDLAVCAEYGAALVTGEGTAKDRERGLKYLRKACDGDNYQGCRSMGMAQVMGPRNADELIMGIAALTKACDGKDGGACHMLGTIKAGLIRIEGIQKDEAQSKAFYKRGCEYGYQASCAASQ